MKQFDIRTDIGGSRMVIYPAGTLAKRNTGAYADAPYIDVQRVTEHFDRYELVRTGFVRERGGLMLRHDQDVQETIQQIVALMKRL